MIPQYFLNNSSLHNIQKRLLQCIQRSGELDLKRRFAVHQFHGAVQKLTDIVNTSPYFRNTTVYTEKSIYSCTANSTVAANRLGPLISDILP